MTARNPNPPPRPRVVHVVESLQTGGLERLVIDMVKSRPGGRASVVCLRELGDLGLAYRDDIPPAEVVGMERGPFSTLRALRRHIRGMRADVVHCHNSLAHLYGALAALASGPLPVVFTKHGTYFALRGRDARLNRVLLRRTQIVAVSEEVAAVMRGVSPQGTRPVQVIANGISLEPFDGLPEREAARRQLGLPVEGYLVGMVSRFAPRKGHDCLVEAFHDLLRDLPAARLVLVGDGPTQGVVKNTVTAEGLDGAVTFLGQRADVPTILSALDVFVLPSENEGMPMSILEAMAARLPVIATSVGGVPQLVANHVTGVLVPPMSRADLARAMLVLGRDRERRQDMGVAGRRRVEERYSVLRTLQAYEGLYSQLLGRKHD